MKNKISQNKIIIFEALCIIVLFFLTIFFIIKLNNQKLKVRYFKNINNKTGVEIKIKNACDENFINLYVNEHNEIFAFDYVSKNYVLYSEVFENSNLFSTVIGPNYNEISSITPIVDQENDEIATKLLRFNSDEWVSLALDKDNHVIIDSGK